MDRFPELQILISEKKREYSFINRKEALERGLLFCAAFCGVLGGGEHIGKIVNGK
jgi:hypothetical protein